MPFKTALKYLIFLITIISNFGCNGVDAQQNCLKAYVKVISTDPEFRYIREVALDTAIQWSRKNLRQFGGYSNEIWEIDSAVFYNENKSKALLLLLQIDKKHGVTFDNVKMIAGEKLNGVWNFYAQSLPTMGFDRNSNNGSKPYTFKELSKKSREAIIKGGFYNNGTCTINYAYVNDWFKEPLAEYHQEFLYNKVD